MKRRRIHSNVKLLVAAGKLPQDYLVTIHRSQLWRYSRMSGKDFFGSELVLDTREAELAARLEEYPVLQESLRLIISLLDRTQMMLLRILFLYYGGVANLKLRVQKALLTVCKLFEQDEEDSTNCKKHQLYSCTLSGFVEPQLKQDITASAAEQFEEGVNSS